MSVANICNTQCYWNQSCKRKRKCHCNCSKWFNDANYNGQPNALYGAGFYEECLEHCSSSSRKDTRQEYLDRFTAAQIYGQFGVIIDGFEPPSEQINRVIKEEEAKMIQEAKQKKETLVKRLFLLAGLLGFTIIGYLMLKE